MLTRIRSMQIARAVPSVCLALHVPPRHAWVIMRSIVAWLVQMFALKHINKSSLDRDSYVTTRLLNP